MIKLSTLITLCSTPSVDEVDLIVLDGQSNNKGVGNVALLPENLIGQIPNQYIWWNDEFQLLEAGVNQMGYSLSFGGASVTTVFGPEMQFAYRRSQAGNTTYFVKVGMGGRTLQESEANPDFSELSVGDLHDDMVARVTDAITFLQNQGKTVNVLKFFWYQGESDGNSSGTAGNYETNLTNKIAAIRNDLSMPNLTIAITRLSDEQSDVTNLSTIQNAQDNVFANISNLQLLNTNSIEYDGDNLHCTEQGYYELGDLYYDNL